MKRYQITKYNPSYRDEYGAYNKDEWTSIYDISKVFDGEILTKEEYINVENSYILAVKSILESNAIAGLTIMDLSKNDSIKKIKQTWSKLGIKVNQSEIELFEKITEGYHADVKETLIILKWILREAIWCRLYSPKEHFVIQCGYDYYMSVTCKNLSDELKQSICSKKLYVEEFPST